MILIAGVSELIRLLEEHHGWVEEEEEEWEETSGGRGSGHGLRDKDTGGRGQADASSSVSALMTVIRGGVAMVCHGHCRVSWHVVSCPLCVTD